MYQALLLLSWRACERRLGSAGYRDIEYRKTLARIIHNVYVDWKWLQVLLKCIKQSSLCPVVLADLSNQTKPFYYVQTKLQSFSNWENHRKPELVWPRYKMSEEPHLVSMLIAIFHKMALEKPIQQLQCCFE